jgi:hypothetical protein
MGVWLQMVDKVPMKETSCAEAPTMDSWPV